MLSRLTPNVDCTDHRYVGSVSKTQLTPKPGEPIKMHIPEIMPNVSSAEASTTRVKTKGSRIFVNDPEGRPVVNTSLTGQDFVSVTCGKGSNWDGIDTVYKAGGRIIKRELKRGITLDCTFVGGLLDHGMIETTRDLTTYNKTAENTSNLYSGDMNHIHVTDPEKIGILSDHVDKLITRLQDSGIIGE